MQPTGNRLARKSDLRRARAKLRVPKRLRWVLSLAALIALVLAAGPAQASPGGASPVASTTAGEDLVFSPFKTAGASWYGPGLYGNKTACGQTLRATTI